MVVQGINQVTSLGFRQKNPDVDPAVADISDFQAIDDDDTPLYKVAEVQLQYIMPTFKVKTDEQVINNIIGDSFQGLPDEGQALKEGYVTNSRYVTRLIKMMSKMLTIPRGMLKDSNKKIIAENIATSEHVAEYIYTWHQVPEEALPELTWIAGTNSVNDDVFDGRPAGTLLFAGEPEIRLNPNPITGQYLYDVTYRFHSLLIFDEGDKTHPKGFNYIRRNDTLGGTNLFRPLLFGWWYTPPGGGPLVFQQMFPNFDFRRFFRPDQ
jgi:hypothetical protein